MARWGYAKRWAATIEERNAAATMRDDAIKAVREGIVPDGMRDIVAWMLSRVSDESLERKVRRNNAEEWFANAIASLKPGDTFTQTGLLETFNAPDEVCGYAQFILSDWSYACKYIRLEATGSEGLMQGAMSCNVYKVL